MSTADIMLPEKLAPVFDGEARIRGAHGGRGSGKTRTFATMAAIQAHKWAQAGREGIILCGREFMNSLDESSMAEVKAAIRTYPWLKPHFDIGENYIRTADRRIEFKFRGLKRNTESIKSMAHILLAWIDEAEEVSKTAWDKLMPTVREVDSEIWVTWNPEKDGSATDKLFRKHPPDDAKIVQINYMDNPWFPKTLLKQMLWDKERDPDKYDWIWLGGYNRKSNTLVFRNWKKQWFETPTDIERFYFGADWGFGADPSVLVRSFIDGRKLYIDYEAYELGCDIDYLPALFAGNCPRELLPSSQHWDNPHEFPGIPGAMNWPIVGDSARPDTISYLRKKGFNINSAKKGAGSVDEGVEFLKSFDIIVHPRCKHTFDELSSYRYKVDPNTEDVLPILVDKDNHVIDSLRYSVEGVRRSVHIPDDLTIGGGSLMSESGGLAIG